MLFTHLNKKADEKGLGLIMALIIAAVVIGLVFGIPLLQSILAAKPLTKAATLKQDDRCLIESQFRVDKIDIDKDGRDDRCDACVCERGCHNENDDKDGDRLPDKCDNDPLNVPEDGKAPEFNKQNCPADKLKIISGSEKEKTAVKQCRP
jgi:hypothetical protein